MQTLTLEEVKAKAREYYDAGKLLAQRPGQAERKEAVFVTDDGYRCAIGAALSDATLALMRKHHTIGGTVWGLVERREVVVSPRDNRTITAMTDIMIKHDLMIGEPDKYEVHEQAFLRLIDHPSAKAKGAK